MSLCAILALPVAAQSSNAAGAEPVIAESWLSDIAVYRPPVEEGEATSHVDPDLIELAKVRKTGDFRVVLELGAPMSREIRTSLESCSIRLLERLRPQVWFATVPLRQVRRGLPIEVRSARLPEPEEKLSWAVRRGDWGPYGMLRVEGIVPLTVSLHGDADIGKIAAYLGTVFEGRVHALDSQRIDVDVPSHMVMFLARMDPVRSVALRSEVAPH